MAKHNWNEITKEDVIKAIECFNNENENYPMPRSTFLLYNDKKYPAKHIRGLAYKVHFKNEISKSEFTGGLETVRFFEKLGFEVQHISKNNTTQVVTVKQESPKTSDEQKNKVNDKSNRIKIPYKEVIELRIRIKKHIHEKSYFLRFHPGIDLAFFRLFAGGYYPDPERNRPGQCAVVHFECSTGGTLVTIRKETDVDSLFGIGIRAFRGRIRGPFPGW